MTITTNISKALIDITGEPRVEIAILELLKDAIEHRLEKIQVEIANLEKKYLMPFEQFQEKFTRHEIQNSYDYNVEMDYLEWEGLISRKRKYQTSLAGLI